MAKYLENSMSGFFNLPWFALLVVLFFSSGCSASDDSRVEYLAFSPTGKWLVAAGGTWLKSGHLKIWECSGWKVYADWTKDFSSLIQNGGFVSEDMFVSIGGKRDMQDKRRYGGNELRFWNVLEKRETEKIDLQNARGFADQIDFSPEKKMLVFNQWMKFGTAAFYYVPNLEKKAEFGADLDFIASLRFSARRENGALL